MRFGNGIYGNHGYNEGSQFWRHQCIGSVNKALSLFTGLKVVEEVS